MGKISEFTQADFEVIARDYADLMEAARKRCHNNEELEVINKAFEFANEAHKGVRRRSGEPYILHPIAVAKIVVQEIGLGYKSIVAALLHDVVEDTPVKMHDLIRIFGVFVADLVADVTENKRTELPPEESWMLRKKEMVVRVAGASKDVKILSLADKLSNLKSIKRDQQEYGDEVWQWFHQGKEKQAWYYRTMREQYTGLKSTAAWKQYDNLVKEMFGGKE